LLIARIDSFLI